MKYYTRLQGQALKEVTGSKDAVNQRRYDEEADAVDLFWHGMKFAKKDSEQYIFPKVRLLLANMSKEDKALAAAGYLWIYVQGKFRKKLTRKEFMQALDQIGGHEFDIGNLDDDEILGAALARTADRVGKKGLPARVKEWQAGAMSDKEFLATLSPAEYEMMEALGSLPE